MPYIDARILITIVLTLALLASYLIFRKKIGQELIIAFLFSLFITSYVEYIYDGFNLTIGTINLYPLVAWTSSLVLLREIYERVEVKFKFLATSLIYFSVLFIVEYIGYYKLGIQLNWDYPSLFGTGVIHGPLVIYAFYLFAGPLYLLVTDYLKVK